MKVIVLTEKYKNLYLVCLEDRSEECKEAWDHKETWYNKMRCKNLRVKIALDDKKVNIGSPPSYEKKKMQIELGLRDKYTKEI